MFRSERLPLAHCRPSNRRFLPLHDNGDGDNDDDDGSQRNIGHEVVSLPPALSVCVHLLPERIRYALASELTGGLLAHSPLKMLALVSYWRR